MYITRVAPSPTGDFHIGTARTAYFNWLAARASGGQFILRIDDTDIARHSEDSVDVIYEALNWLDLNPDVVIRQSDRMDLYKKVAQDLLDAGKATHADNGAVILNGVDSLAWEDSIGGRQFPNTQNNDLARNQVLIRADGMPVYHFASVVDDVDMNVNWIIRGIDHHTNTFRHSAIYSAMTAKLPMFAHVGLIMLNGKKMSKRDAAASLLGYKKAGYSPEAILNFVLRMGWGPKIDDKTTATISRDRALELFLDGGKMKSSPAAFDQHKLDSLNRKYKAMEGFENPQTRMK